MSAYSDIKDKIKDKIDAIAKIAETQDDPQVQFRRFPAAVIVPSSLDSDYQTNAENQRVYAFEVNIFYEVDNTGVGSALDALYDLADDVFNAFDTDQQLKGLSLPSNYTMIAVEPVPAGWESEDNYKMLKLNIKILVRVTYDIT